MEIKITEFFDSAHRLEYTPELYSTSCMNMHGHTYKCEVIIYGNFHPLVCDFGIVKGTIRRFDHREISTVFSDVGYEGITTAENIVNCLWGMLTKGLPTNVKIKEISLWEGWKGTDTNKVTITEEDR